MKKKAFIFWSLLAAVALARLIFSLNVKPPDASACLKNIVNGVGTISGEPERKETGQVFVVDANELAIASSSGMVDFKCGGGISVRLKTKLYPRFKYGDSVSFTGKMSRPMNFQSGAGRAFDYAGYLAKDDVFYEMKSAVVMIATTTHNADLSSALFSIRRSFVSNLERTLGEPHAALGDGLVVGEKSALGKNLLDDFRAVGLIHIVVLSGFNITVVAAALRKMLSFLPRVWGITVGGVGIMLFGVMVGGGATVARSCAMAGIALAADLIRRDYQVARALVFAALVMLIQNPMILLHDPSFQLSFLATTGLILLAEPIEGRLGFIPEKFGLRGLVASTFATQIFVSSYILYMMGQISIVGVFANILVLPFIPATMLLIFLTGATGFFSHPISQLIGWSAHLLLSYELFIVEHFARLPFSALHVPAFSFWWVAGFYVLFILGFVFFKKRRSSNSSQSRPN